MPDGIDFIKMQGAGNDFILVQHPKEREMQIDTLARRICDRRFGVGADGLMSASLDHGKVYMRYVNADGSMAAVCGNGLRCFAKYAAENGMVQGDEFEVATDAGPKQAKVFRDEKGEIQSAAVMMGRPVLLPYEIPALLPGEKIIDYPLWVGNRKVRINCLRVGVPHAVVFWNEKPDEEMFCSIGKAVERHLAFPEGINFDLAVQVAQDAFSVYTWERGAGHTLACGTGCCAVAAAARLSGRSSADRIRLEAEGGILWAEIREWDQIILFGDARKICTGHFFFDESLPDRR